MDRDTKGTHGVFVLTKDMTKVNIEHWKNEMKSCHESPNQYGKSKAIEFEEVTEEDGSRYISFWVD